MPKGKKQDRRNIFMAKIPKYYVRPDGLHESIIVVTMADGTRKRKAFRGKTDTEVYNKIKAYGREAASHPDGVLFKVEARAWWNAIEPTLEYNTIKSCRPAYKRAVDRFGEEVAAKLTAKEIDRYIQEFAVTRARKTVVTQLQVIRQILRQAELDGVIHYNPAQAVRPPRNLPQTRREAPTKEEIQRIKDSVNLPFGLFAFLIYHTGCRRGEALALKGTDIDRKKRLVHITKSIYHEGNKPRLKRPKTEKGYRGRTPLSALDTALPKRLGKGFLFSLDGGETPLTNDKMTELYDQYRAASGVTVTAHQIRHGYATALFENGIDPKTAQTLLGHAQLSTTMDIYTHVCQDVISAAAEKMEKGF